MDAIEAEPKDILLIDKPHQISNSTLYNSDAMKVMKEKLETMIGENSLEEVNKITGNIVKASLCKNEARENGCIRWIYQ